jgi:hypothetical protein
MLREIRFFKLRQEKFHVGMELALSCRISGSHSGGYEELYLVGCNAVCATSLHAGFLLAFFFNTEDGCDMLVRNVSWLLSD